MGNETVRVTDVYLELERLTQRYYQYPVAVEALEAVKYWLMEESVENEEE